MDDLEFLTPVDSRLEKEYKSTTTLESSSVLSNRSFNNPSPTRSNESSTEEDGTLYNLNKDILVPNGLNSILFLPLVHAVFKPINLKKELVVKIDIQELTKALIIASSGVESVFTVLGNHVKGLCLLLSHQIKYLSADFMVYSKRLVGTDVAVFNKPETSKYFESDDEYREKTKRKQRKRKIKDTDSVTTVQDYSDKYQGELVPVERLEMLRAMNLGLSGNDLLFMSNQVSPVLKDYLKEMNLSNKVSGDRDWLSFDDLRMLSTPFKLNGYSFTSNMDSPTVAATSDLSYSTTYDLDWSLRNDPLNYKSSYYETFYNNYALDDGYNDNKVLALDDDKARKKRKSATLRMFDIDLVRAEIKYDRKPNKYRPKRKPVERRMPSFKDKKLDGVQQHDALALSQSKLNTNQTKLSQMFDKYFTSLVNSDSTEVNKEFGCVLRTNVDFMSANTDNNQKEAQVQMNERQHEAHKQPDLKDRRVEVQSNKPVVEKEVNRVVQDKMYETSFQETTDGYGTLDVLNWLRDTFRKGDFNSINFERLTRGLKASKVSVVFLRVLILANSNFISVSQEREVITIAPAERFWEPVNVRLSLPTGS